MQNSKDNKSPVWRRSLKRRQFLANLLFAGGALSVVGLNASVAEPKHPETEGWTLPKDLTENIGDGWVLPKDLKDPVPPKKPPKPIPQPEPPLMGSVVQPRPVRPPVIRGKVAPPRKDD